MFRNVWWRWIHLDESFFNWVESTWRWWMSIGGENGKQQLRWRTWLWLQPTFQVAHLEFRISHLPIFDGKVDKSHIPQSFKLRVNSLDGLSFKSSAKYVAESNESTNLQRLYFPIIWFTSTPTVKSTLIFGLSSKSTGKVCNRRRCLWKHLWKGLAGVLAYLCAERFT